MTMDRSSWDYQFIAPGHSSPASAAAASALGGAPSFSRRIADIRIPAKARQVSTGWLLAAALIICPAAAGAAEVVPQPSESDTLSNVPQMLSGECESPRTARSPGSEAQIEKGRVVHHQVRHHCIRGGDGSPGEGPLNIRRPLVVFKQGFRSRKYCLVECSDICNLIGDEDYGP
ncbi:uncharacterized protein J3R85_000773 [Psidium guajava]|nr:uncharacterized protein J3R85_000773 [Psidium guajava]